MTDAIHALIEGVPKAELHVHLEGTLEPGLIDTLAERNGRNPGFENAAAVHASREFSDLPSFLSAYYAALNVLQTEDDFFDLAYHYFERAAMDGVVYVEAFFDPQAHTARGVSIGTVMNGLSRAKKRALELLGLRANFILCFLRDKTEAEAMVTLEQALPYRDRFIAVGLDSDGFDNPPARFQRVFARARAEGFKLTMHAEFDQKDIHRQLWECVNLIGVDRIDHGANTIDDPVLTQQIRDRNIGLTICPLSTYFINQTYTLDHIRRLLDAGIRVTINSDDPAYFHGYINDNLRVLVDQGGFSRGDILQVVRNAFDICWLDPSEKAGYLAQVEAYADSSPGN